jgi:hypothetical protein
LLRNPKNWIKRSMKQRSFLTRGNLSHIKPFLGCIHNWGTKKEWLVFKGLWRTTLNFFRSYIIIVGVNCCMSIDIMMSC